MIDYIIVDDEPLAHDLIENFCKDLPHLYLKKNCYNALEAMQFLNLQAVDLMFLDLNMPKLKGFDFLRTLSKPPLVIVTTAYKEFALEGFELNVIDYLLKPFSFDRFLAAINKAVALSKPVNQSNNALSNTHSNRFFVKSDKKYYQVDSSQISYVEAFGNYTKIYLSEEYIVNHDNISSMQQQLPADNFIRVHKSFLVAVDKINSIEGNRILIGEQQIPIGQTYRIQVNRILKK